MSALNAVNVGIGKLHSHHNSSQNRILIKGGMVINHDFCEFADVYIENGTIKEVGQNLTVPGGIKILDATGLLVMPGGIDGNTHFEAKFGDITSPESMYSGSKAALSGGTTMIINNLDIDKNTKLSDKNEVSAILQKISEESCCDFSLHLTMPPSVNSGEVLKTITETLPLSSLRAPSSSLEENEENFFNWLRLCRENHLLAQVSARQSDESLLGRMRIDQILKSADNGGAPELIKNFCDKKAVMAKVVRAISLADAANCPLLMSEIGDGDIYKGCHQDFCCGTQTFLEIGLASLCFDGSGLNDTDWGRAACNIGIPQITHDCKTMFLEMLSSHSSTAFLSSHHSVFSVDQKSTKGLCNFSKIAPAFNGGVEERMGILWEFGVKAGFVSVSEFVALTSANAARLFGLYPKKGCIAVGSDADIVLWNPEKDWKFSTIPKSHYSPYSELKGKGSPVAVVAKGHIIFDCENPEVKVTQGQGSPVFGEKKKQLSFGVNDMREEQSLKGVTTVVRQLAAFEVTAKQNGSAKKDEEETPAPVPSVAVAATVASPRAANARNQFQSSISFGGDGGANNEETRPSTKLHQPPGGKSSALW